VLDIALKDLLRSFRSAMFVGMTLAAPLLITGLIYLAFGGFSSSPANVELPPVTVGVVNLDQPAAQNLNFGGQIVDFLKGEQMPTWLTAKDYPDEAAARKALEDRQLGMVLILPADLSTSVSSGKPAAVTLLSDPTLSLTPRIVQEMVQLYLDGATGATAGYQAAFKQLGQQGITLDAAGTQQYFDDYVKNYTALQSGESSGASLLETRTTGKPTGNQGLQTMFAGILAGQMIFFAFYSGAYASMSILKEGEEGTLPRLFTTPTHRTTILTGKVLAVFMTVLVQIPVLLLLGSLAFKIHWGQPLVVLAALLASVVACSGLGLFLISFVKTTQQAGPVLGGGLTALGMFGGLFTVAVPNLPAAFTTIAKFTPQGWAMNCWKLALQDAALSEIAVPALVLTGIGLVLFVVGNLNFRRRMA
ncbi:MAG: ABC transporter permease, partial [Anaerolineaceae bacterium]|nr:ABC transporter permease [Anaerolineaceae bacterium]